VGTARPDPIGRPYQVRFLHDEALLVLPRILDTFGIRRPILVGHSDGASIALIYAGSSAAAAPRALLLEAPHVFVEDITVTEIAAMRERYSTTNLRTRLARHHSHVDTLFQRWTDIWLDPQFRSWNIDACLPRVTCPVLVVQGRNDQHGTASQVIAVMGGVRGRSESVMLANCRHSPHRDQRVLVELLMTRFIRANGSQIEDRTSSGV
jgi:pimeloyl-ACP methyl ester carboxylesterase